ncbi:MAG: hypothetical protein H6729_07935 [Deltaproteobacteria bacterium]|nr:hypothetical protein [Deltaproteobacteria bacterium]
MTTINPRTYAIQNYMPPQTRRELTASEIAQIDQKLDQLIPKINPGYSTPIPDMLASPKKQAFALTAVGTALGLVVGVLVPSGARTTRALSALVGAAVGAGGGACLGTVQYFSRRERNENYIDIMRRLPEGATRRDMLSDPAIQADLNRETALQAATVIAASSR